MSFRCACCRRHVDLGDLADLSCSCLVCAACARASIEEQLCRDPFNASITPPQHQQQKEPPRQHVSAPRQSVLEPGDEVLYRTADGNFVEATVEIVDVSVTPPQYGIQLVGAPNLRFTEQNRLISTKAGTGAAAPPPPRRAHASAQPQASPPPSTPARVAANCACCSMPLPPHAIRTLAPEAVAAWEAARTASWLKVHDVIACPHRGCGALIQRVPQPAAGAAAQAPAPAARGVAADTGSATAAAAAAHRERHRYRCGACSRDFCDACLAAPYHTGFTCRQARAPDCLLCGGKVEEDRLEKLLPRAAAAVAADDEGGGGSSSAGVRRSQRLRGTGASTAPGSGARAEGLSGVSRPGGPTRGVGEADMDAAAVVAHATNAELRSVLRSKLGINSVWCIERGDFERALLHWGCHTCSSPDCAAKLRAMCTRPLPCGHWCCGLRGEGEAGAAHGHPRCVECGASADAAASPEVGAAAMIGDCCFCWEALASAPCIEMACAPRHMCHLHCALARLAAGYPGPHISFTHLYCPLCRNAGGGAGDQGSGALQSALGPVHLQHPALAAALQPHLDLRTEVVAAVRARLRLDPALKAEPELQPGGRYDGRPADFGLEKLLFYECTKCSKPYYGGQRACGAGAAGDAQQQQPQQPQGAAAAAAGGAGGHRRRGGAGAAPGPQPGQPAQQQEPQEQQLVCGECCARNCGANCPRHGTTYIEWKCKYCCSLASWFCWGTTHMCEPCHRNPGAAMKRVPQGTSADSRCTDPKCRLKDTPHPPPGHEACLGCGMCRVGL